MNPFQGLFNSIGNAFKGLMAPKTPTQTPPTPAPKSVLPKIQPTGNLFSDIAGGLTKATQDISSAIKPAPAPKLTPMQQQLSQMTTGEKYAASAGFVKDIGQGLAKAAAKFGVSVYQVPETLKSGGVPPEAVPVPKILQNALGEKEISSYQKDTATDIENGMNPVLAVGKNVGSAVFDAWVTNDIVGPVAQLAVRSAVKALPDTLLYKVAESKIPVADVMHALRGTGEPGQTAKDFVNSLSQTEKKNLFGLARTYERTGAAELPIAGKEPSELGKFLGVETPKAKPTVPEIRAGKALPGYTEEPAVNIGLRIKKVTPVGGTEGISKEMVPLMEEAKKYESADEFVNKFLNESPIQTPEINRTIRDLGKVGIKISSPDEIITLYHGTNAKGMKGISESKSLNPFSYLATDRTAAEGFSFGKKGGIVEIKVPISDAGYVQQAMAGKKGATIQSPFKLVKGEDGIYRADKSRFNTRSQLTEIWNKAHGSEIKAPEKGTPEALFQETKVSPTRVAKPSPEAKISERKGVVEAPTSVNEAIKAIAGSKTPDEIAKTLTDLGVKDELISDASRKLATMKDEGMISQKLGALMKQSGVEAVFPKESSLRVGPKGIEETRPLEPQAPTESQKSVQVNKTEAETKTAQIGETQQKTKPLSLPEPEKIDFGDSFKNSIARAEIPVTKKVNLLDYMKTPEKVFTKLGLQNEMVALRKGWDSYQSDLKKDIMYLRELRDKAPSTESSQKIFQWLDGKEIQLTPAEREVGMAIKKYLENWAEKLELPAEARITNYITHIFERGIIEKEFDPDLAKIIDSKVPSSVYDPFLLKRVGAVGYKEDVWKALDAYTKRADRKYNMDRPLTRLSFAADKLDNETFKYIQKYAARLNLRPSEIDNLLDNLIKSSPIGYRLGQRPTNVITGTIRKAIYRATLGLNVTSALRNLTQGVNSYAMLGEKYTLLGYTDFMKHAATKDLEELYANGVLNDEISMESRLGVVQNFWRRLDDTLFFFFENVEKINRGSAYFGAKKKAIDMGMSEENAVEYAKRIVRQTQFAFGQIDSPVALSSDIAKTLATLQTYNIKQIELLASMAKDKNFSGLLRYIGGSIVLFMSIGKLFGMQISDIIPSARLGGSPVGTAVTATQIIDSNPQKKAEGMKALQRLAMFPIPASSQLLRSYTGLSDYYRGFTQTASGKVKYTIPQDAGSFIRAILFGSNTLPDAQEYYSAVSAAGNAGQTQAAAEDEYTRLKQLPKEEAAKDFDAIAKQDPALAKAITKIFKEDALGLTPTERMMGLMTIANGQRAKFIAEEIAKLDTNKKKADFWQNLVEKKIITPAVAKQLNEAMSAGSPVSNGSHTSTGLIDTIATYAKAIGTDPLTAFNRIFTGQRITRVDNGAVIVERMPLRESQQIKKELGATSRMTLDHIIPLELGGSNSKENLQLVPEDIAAEQDKVENYLGAQLKRGVITKDQAQDLMVRYKKGELKTSDIIKVK